jgi:hypothetical protein
MRSSYPWPVEDYDVALSEALDIAMSYLEQTGQAEEYRDVERLVVTVILATARRGVKHKLPLANAAIAAIEKLPITVPRVWYG